MNHLTRQPPNFASPLGDRRRDFRTRASHAIAAARCFPSTGLGLAAERPDTRAGLPRRHSTWGAQRERRAMVWTPEGFISAPDAVSRVAVTLYADVEPEWHRPELARQRLWQLLAGGSIGAWIHNAGAHQPRRLPPLWCQVDGMMDALRCGYFARTEKAEAGGWASLGDRTIAGELLLDERQIAALVGEPLALADTCKSVIEPPITQPNKLVSERRFKDWYARYRQGLGARVPSEKQDIMAARKEFGTESIVPRNSIREIRKSFPKLPKGRPKSKSPL